MPEPIAFAIVVPGSTQPAGDGKTGALRCVVRLPDQRVRRAFLKRGPLGQIGAEAFGSLLLRQWGLRVPEPYLVDEDGELAFACADAGYPNLSRRLGLADLPDSPAKDAALAAALFVASTLPSAPLAAAADEGIDNRDRNLQNIIWDGEDATWIDHAMSFGQGALAGFSDRNILCEIAMRAERHDHLSAAAQGQALGLSATAANEMARCLPEALDPLSLADFVNTRIGTIAMRLLRRFPQPQDLLSGL